MAIEMHDPLKEPKHRCTDCGAKWWPEGKTGWVECTIPAAHPCPTCSAPEPEPVVVEREACDTPEYHEGGPWYRYCPRCGVALKAKEEG